MPLFSIEHGIAGCHGAGSLGGVFRSRARRGNSAHACSSNSCFAWLGLGFASSHLHSEHPQAAKELFSSQTSCLAMAEHSPTAWSGLLGQFRAGHLGQNVALAALIEHTIEHNFSAAPALLLDKKLNRLAWSCLKTSRRANVNAACVQWTPMR